MPLAHYRAKRIETAFGPKLDTDDAYAKSDVVAAEIVAMGYPADVAEFAANVFVWNAGYLDAENLFQMQAQGALSAWVASKAERVAA
jgi:hypothetical protein